MLCQHGTPPVLTLWLATVLQKQKELSEYFKSHTKLAKQWRLKSFLQENNNKASHLTFLPRNSITTEGYPAPLALRVPSETSSKDTDHTGTEIRDPGATTGHITSLCQGKTLVNIVIVNNFVYEITIRSSLLFGFSPLPNIKPLKLKLRQHFPSYSAVPTSHNFLPHLESILYKHL